MTPLLGQLFAIITAACWAQNSLIYSHTGKIVGSRTVTHIRLWIALPMIMLLNQVFTGSLIPMGIPGRTWLLFILSGVIGFCMADLFIFRAFVELGPRQTMVIMTTSPIFSALLSRTFNNDILNTPEITGMLVTLAGVGLVVYYDRPKQPIKTNRYTSGDGKQDSDKQHNTHIRGVAVALLGSLAQAVGVVLSKGGLADNSIHPVSANYIRLVAGLAALTLFALARNSFRKDFKEVFSPGRRPVLLLLVSAALVGPVGGIILNLYALSVVSAGVVAALSQVTPIMLLPYERLVQKKRIQPGAAAGTLVAIIGVFILFIVPN